MRYFFATAFIVMAGAASADLRYTCDMKSVCQGSICEDAMQQTILLEVNSGDLVIRGGESPMLLRRIRADMNAGMLYHGFDLSERQRRMIVTLFGDASGTMTLMPDSFEEPWSLMTFDCTRR